MESLGDVASLLQSNLAAPHCFHRILSLLALPAMFRIVLVVPDTHVPERRDDLLVVCVEESILSFLSPHLSQRTEEIVDVRGQRMRTILTNKLMASTINRIKILVWKFHWSYHLCKAGHCRNVSLLNLGSGLYP